MWSGSTSSDQTATPAAIEGAENGAERAERGPGRPLFWTGCGSISPRRCGCFIEGNQARFSPFGVGEHVGEHDVLPSTVTAGKTDPDDI